MSFYRVPQEIRVNNHTTHYTVDFVYGLMNVVYGQRKFCTYRDLMAYCRTEWFGVPVIRNSGRAGAAH